MKKETEEKITPIKVSPNQLSIVFPDVLGKAEGDTCGLDGCPGVLGFQPVENCSCHINPPCDACVNNPLVCLECGREVS